MNELSIFTIYDHPKDRPEKVVVREWLVDKHGIKYVMKAEEFDTLEEARERLRSAGLGCLPAQEGDDSCMVESWI